MLHSRRTGAVLRSGTVGEISKQVTRKARFDVQRGVVCSFMASHMLINDDDNMTHGR